MKLKTAMFTVFFTCIICVTLSACGANHAGQVKVPSAAQDFLGSDYAEVITQFRDAGFTNIQTTALGDLITGWLVRDGSVESISINGTSDFKKNAWFDPNVDVVITYHSFPSDKATSNETDEPSIYSTLSDEQFVTLTDALSESFYTFTLSNADYQVLANEPDVMACLTQIYQYGYEHTFELDPAYMQAFSDRYDLIASQPCYQTLDKNFLIDLYYTDQGTWEYSIRSYALAPEDVVSYDGTLYVDAEGYLNKDVVLYWLEDGAMVAVGTVADIARDTEIDGTVYGYAVNITFYDDPASSGWMDGEVILTANKKLSGKPLYYVAAQDANRSVAKEPIDYSNSVSWVALNRNNAVSGTDVYLGSNLTDSKTLLFTITGIDEAKDTMRVTYPSGSIETKSYSAMLEKGTLYIQN